MPRYVTKRRKRLDTKTRAERASRLHVRKPKFIDAFPFVHGTLPEKMVYNELSRRRIPFLFLNDIRFLFPEIDFDKTYQADFVIPSEKIIIEVQGSYWHSMTKTIEADAFKFAVYEMAGYRVLAWWDYDIFDRIQNLFASDPVLNRYHAVQDGGISSELPVISRQRPNTSKGIITLNRRRAQRMAYKKAAVRQKKRR